MFYSLPRQTLRLSNLIRFSVVALLLVIVVAIASGPLTAYAATWTSSAKFGSWTSGGYTVANDVWGSGAGPQTIWANSGSNWGITSNQPNTGGVKSYPHSDRDLSRTLSALKSVTSSFNVTVPGSGAYETAYDIWANGYAYEIMLWMNKTGAVGPIGSYQTRVTVGNYSWNVYKGSNGSNQVFSFLNTGSTTAGTVNVLAILRWIQSKGWYGNVTLSHVQFGFEITSTGAKSLKFTDNSYSVSYS